MTITLKIKYLEVRLLRVYLSNLDHEANGLPVQLPLPFNRPRPSGVDDIFAGM
jgi:hypothetical protein